MVLLCQHYIKADGAVISCHTTFIPPGQRVNHPPGQLSYKESVEWEKRQKMKQYSGCMVCVATRLIKPRTQS